MEIAILVFFLAIFGGILFLLALVWFIFRRIRNSRPARRNFASGSNPGAQNSSSDDDADDFYENSAGAVYADNLMYGSQSDENPAPLVNQSEESSALTATAQDSPYQSESAPSHDSHGASAAPAETSYAESSYSSYDSGSSSDSSSSYDSGSSSSDSGGSSWSSD